MKDILGAIAEYSAKLKFGGGDFTSLVLAALLLTPIVSAQELKYDEPATGSAEQKADQDNLAAITVTSTADVIDAAASCATVTIASLPGPNGVTSLREAVCAANTNAGADSITFVVNGIFALTGAANEDNGGTGDLDLKDSVAITGNGIANTIIDGSGIERIFDVFPSADRLSLGLAAQALGARAPSDRPFADLAHAVFRRLEHRGRTAERIDRDHICRSRIEPRCHRHRGGNHYWRSGQTG